MSRLFFEVERPRSYWDVVGAHFPFVLFLGVPLLASLIVPEGGLSVEVCWFLHLTGYPCPFCGLTRSFAAIGHGDWRVAWVNGPFWVVVYVSMAFLFLWHATGLLLGVRLIRGRCLRPSPRVQRFLWMTLLVLLLANWGYRVVSGLK